MDLPFLEFKDDGTYLDGRRLSYITEFQLESKAELHPNITELYVTGVMVDTEGSPLLDEHNQICEYSINQYVVVKGLDDQLK